MRLVVGPLPASVYWRRRALVLGGLVLAVLIITYSCTTAAQTVDPKAVKSPTRGPITMVSPTSQGVAPVNQVSPTASPIEPSPVPNAETCTDAELKVTPVPAKTTMAPGTEIQIKLLIKNIGGRTCNRDVGADMQELRIVLGTEKLWSSDDCGGLTGSDVRQFPPNLERSYEVTWNGHSSSACSPNQKRTPTGPLPAQGSEYQLFGRVGTALSDPVILKFS
jgi:hypothetical protein